MPKLSLAWPLAALCTAAAATMLGHGCKPQPGDSDPVAVDGGVGDSLSETPVTDAGNEEGPFGPGWARFKNAPPKCEAYVALDPTSAVEPFEWQPCKSGKVGCQQLVSPSSYREFVIADFEPMRYLDGRMIFSYRQNDIDDRGDFTRTRFVVRDVAGTVLHASALQVVRPGGCAVGWSSNGASVGFISFALSDAGNYQFGHSTPDALVPQLQTFARGHWGESPSSIPYAQGYANSVLYLHMNGPPGMGYLDFAQGRDGVVGSAAQPRAELAPWTTVRDGALALQVDPNGYLAGLAWVNAEHKPSLLTQMQAGRIVQALAVDRAEQDALVWIEADDVDPTIGAAQELWTSPFAKDGSGIARRKVSKDNPGGLKRLSAHRGRAAYLNGDRTTRVVRLSDGKGWLIKADPGFFFKAVAGLTDDEVWIFTTTYEGGSMTGILRVRIDSLGEPEAF